MEFGLWIDVEGDGRAVLGHINALGNEWIHGKGFIPDAAHQAVIDKVETFGCCAFDGVGVEGVKAACGGFFERSAFRRTRISIFEMRSFRSVFRIAVHGKAVKRFGVCWRKIEK